MAKRQSPGSANLQAQAAATRHAAESCNDEVIRSFALAAASTVEAIAKATARREASPILNIPANASDSELREARQYQSVRRGNEVFLPIWRQATIGMPNLFLRSALFASNRNQHDAVVEETIASQGDTSITLTGFRLNDYDRRVFAVCLNAYRDDRMLASTGDDVGWVRLSYWLFAKAMGVSYGPGVHLAIRASLVRLNAAHLRLRVKRRDVPMPRLLEVAFDDGYQPGIEDHGALKGSDLIAFRVQESMANLFGPEDWSAVHESAIHGVSGLAAWLASFYSTHAKPYPLQVKDLCSYAGVVCSLREFRRRLKGALAQLMAPDVPDDIRIAEFELSNLYLVVKLCRWSR